MIVLKVNNFFKKLLKIFLEFLAINSPNYHKGILLQLLIFKYLENYEITHPLFEFLKNEFSSLIEESNESQLSLLFSKDENILSNHKIIKEKYLFLPTYFSINKHFQKKKTY